MELSFSTSILEKDSELIWHPFTQHMIDPHPIPLVKGRGVYLYAENGEKYLDAISSWWCNLHGHSNRYIANKIFKQATTLEHAIFANYTHEPAVTLAERLKPLLPSGLSKFFFSDNGSTANEVAIKMALQYHYNKGKPKTHVVSFTHAYHGDTLGAMSLAGHNDFSKPFHPLMFKTSTLQPPTYGNEEQAIKEAKLLFSKPNIAAFIYEPILQGVGGMIPHNPSCLQEILQIAQQHGVLLIADEVLTGFGRVGPLFASSLTSVSPDFICLSKGLTGGFLPLALTVTQDYIYQAFLNKDRKQSFLHGHTYTANPLGCSAALASLDLTLSQKCQNQRQLIESCHKQFKKDFGHLWKRCDVIGTVLALDYPSLKEESGYFASLRDILLPFFTENNILLRPLGNTIYVLPPYPITKQELQKIYSILRRSLCIIQ